MVQTQCWCPKDRDSRYDDSVVLIIIDSVQFRVGGRGLGRGLFLVVVGDRLLGVVLRVLEVVARLVHLGI